MKKLIQRISFVQLGLLILAVVSGVLALEISWPMSMLFSGLDRREASERLWVLVPVIVVCWYLFASRRGGHGPHSAGKGDVLQLRLSDWLFVLIMVIHIAVQGNYANLRETLWMGFGTPVAVSTAVGFGVLLLRLKHLSNVERAENDLVYPDESSDHRGQTLTRLCVATLVVLAPFYIIGFGDLIDAYHSAWVLNETMSWLSDHPAGLEAPIQYGSLVYSPVIVINQLVGWATSDAVVSAFVWLSILSAIFLISFSTVASLLMSSVKYLGSARHRWASYTLPGLALVFMTQGTPTFSTRNTGSILALLTSVPVRNVLPMLLLVVLLAVCSRINGSESKGEATRSPWLVLHVVFFLLATLTMLNNFEFGAPIALSSLVIWLIVLFRRRAQRIRAALVPLVIGVVVLVLVTVRSSATGETYFSNWIAFSDGYGADSYSGVFMDEFGAHFLVIVWTYLSIILGLKRLVFRQGDGSVINDTVSIVMLYCGCWSLVCLMYFSGRSVPSGQLQSSLVPLALLLLAWSLPVLVALVGQRGTIIDSKIVVVSLFSLSFLFGSSLNIVDFGSRWSEVDGSARSQVELLWSTYPEELANDVLEANRLIQPPAMDDQIFVHIKYPNIFSHLTGLKTVGVLNGPDAIVTSERIRNIECTAIEHQLSETPGTRVFVHKDSLPTLDKGLSASDTFIRLCPRLSRSVNDTDTFLVVDL